uniref:Uncharacterized protein n=1 Tax=Arundo donax TaxID=35708 RepID=A0A0A9AFS1_ARUDO
MSKRLVCSCKKTKVEYFTRLQTQLHRAQKKAYHGVMIRYQIFDIFQIIMIAQHHVTNKFNSDVRNVF